jgi:two-component system sensor histidine kinase TctE
MLAPLLLLWPMSIAITYLVAKSIANQPFDHALEDSVTVLAQQVRSVDGKVIKSLSGSARDILRADDVDNVYFQIQGPRGEHVDGDRDCRCRWTRTTSSAPARVRFRNDSMHGTQVRIAYSYVRLERNTADEPQLALVQVAETLEKRAKLANEIIKGVILPQFIILPMSWPWCGLRCRAGCRRWPSCRSASARAVPTTSVPIDPRQVPEEISPLVARSTTCWRGCRSRSKCKSASSPTPRTRCARRWRACACSPSWPCARPTAAKSIARWSNWPRVRKRPRGW